MEVTFHATYRGAELGPVAGKLFCFWTQAICKYDARVTTLVEMAPPVAALPSLHRSYTTSVLWYLVGIALLPPDFPEKERHTVGRLLRFPGNKLPRRGWVELAVAWGWPPLCSAETLAQQRRRNTADRHAYSLTALAQLADQEDGLILARLTSPAPMRDTWDHPSAVKVLRDTP